MNHYYFLFLLLFSGVSWGQSTESNDEETCIDFDMMVIDYEVYDGNVVAVSKKRGNYFIHYTNPNGEKLSQEFDIFLATDLELDSQGELVLVGVDSTYFLAIDKGVQTTKTVPTNVYRGGIPYEVIDFPETQAHVINNMILFRDKGASLGEDVIGQIILEHQTTAVAIKEPSNRMRMVNPNDLRDQPLEQRPPPTLQRNDYIARPSHGPVAQLNSSSPGRARMIQESISFYVMKHANCLWLVNNTEQELSVYSSKGLHLLSNPISAYPSDSKLVNDPVLDIAYFMRKPSTGRLEIIQLNQDGSTTSILEMKKGFAKSDLKIRGGYLYYRDSKGKGESIKRTKL